MKQGTRRFVLLAAAAPCLTVAITRVVSATPLPTLARAGASQTTVSEALAPPPRPTARQLAAVRAVQSMDLPTTESSPFYFPSPVEDVDEPEIEEAEEDVLPPDWWAVTSFIGGRRPIAVVNGRPMTIGDTIDEGWKVLRIDPQARTVTLERNGNVAVLEQVGGR